MVAQSKASDVQWYHVPVVYYVLTGNSRLLLAYQRTEEQICVTHKLHASPRG